MDLTDEEQRQRNPRERASILSIVTFAFTFPLFKKSLKRDLEESDVYEVLPSFASNRLGDTLEKNFNRQRENLQQPSLYRALFECYAKRYFLLGAIQLLFKMTLIFLQPALLNKITSYFQPSQTAISRSDLYLYASLLIVLNIFEIIFFQNYYQLVTEEGIKMRTALTSVIYRKALRLSSHHLTEATMGKVVTLITKDVFTFEQLVVHLNDGWIHMVEAVVIFYLIYSRMGYSVLSGIGFLLLMLLLQCYFGKKASSMRIKSAKYTDERVQLTKEAISAIKIFKMFSWENSFANKLNELRRKEVKYLASLCYMKSVIFTMSLLSSTMSFFLILMTFTWTNHSTDIDTLQFTNISFSRLRQYFFEIIPNVISKSSDVHASLERIEQFLDREEVSTKEELTIRSTSVQTRLFLHNVSVDIDGKQVLKEVSLSLEKGLHLLTGNSGSGKSVLLKTILGDYPVIAGQVQVNGSISYAPQDFWFFPSTIKQNILFGQEYDEERYKKVLAVCALDFNKYELRDDIPIGNHWNALSKGQLVRINLARAVYRKADIYLLDNCLSHLDPHVNMYIFKECVMEFLEDKIVILITYSSNHLELVSPQQILVMEEGRIYSNKHGDCLDHKAVQCIHDSRIDTTSKSCEDFVEDDIEDQVNETTELSKSVKHVHHEEKRLGEVSLEVYLHYFKIAGGPIMLSLLLLLYIACYLVNHYTEHSVTHWMDTEPNITFYMQTNGTDSSEYSKIVGERKWYSNFYWLLISLSVVFAIIRTYFYVFCSIRASVTLHKSLNESVMNSFMTFFDRHYVGNIVNRFSKDLSTIDETIPAIIHELLKSNVELIGLSILVSSANPVFLMPLGVLFLLMRMMQKFYLTAGRSVKRLESSVRSPMVGHVNATLEGLSIVRTFKNHSFLIREFDKHQNHFTSVNYLMTTLMRALTFYGALICSIFNAMVILIIVIFDTGPSVVNVGLIILQASNLASAVLCSMRQFADFESNMTATERVLEYTNIPAEKRKSGQIVENWPDRGKIEFRDVSLTSSSTKQKLLDSLSFVIQPGEKIGIVGDTGLGVSSIVSSLFRLYDIEGGIAIDGVDINFLPLEVLRTNISLIPYDSILFPGTIRFNIDPTGEFSDDSIWNALKAVNLTHLIPHLEDEVKQSGIHFSCSQKHLICLARALVRKNKIIVFDETTADLDSATCELMQKIIREHFSGCTVLIISHRMEMVLDSDRVMMLYHNGIVEFDNPDVLLKIDNGVFNGMVKQTGIID